MKLSIVSLIFLSAVTLTWCFWNNDVREKEAEQIEEIILTVPRTTIHALWDSLTAWYQLPSEDSYPAQLESMLLEKWYDIKVLNWGISWDTSKWLLTRLDRQLESANKDDIAFVVIGANDWLRGMPLDQMKKNITTISEIILEKELFLILWWMQIPLNNSPEYRATFEQIYVDICSSYKLNPRVSCIEFFLEWVGGRKQLNLPDGIHPTKEGYNVIVNNILPIVEKTLQELVQ